MHPDKILILRQQKIIEELEKNVMKLEKGNDYLKAELTYWEETAEFYLRELNKTKQSKTLDN